jgi:succinoglycan biosynthesis protein ExoM
VAGSQTERRVLIAVATYRRPHDLRKLLDSLQESADNSADVLVVDNDPAQSARNVVATHSLAPTYVAEPEPGIASARNRALAHFSDEYFGIIFVDDDEWVDERWFAALVDFTVTSGVGVAQGAVLTVLPDNAPAWIRRGSFYQRDLRSSGTPLSSAATNNTLLTREAWIRAGQPTFDPAFSTTGGSDWDLFWCVRKAGSSITYCAEAVVYENVPQSRLSWKWLRQRFIRNGVVESRVQRKHGEPMFAFLMKAALVFVVGCLQVALDFASGRGRQAKSLRRVFIPIGKFAAIFGYRIHEYKRN